MQIYRIVEILTLLHAISTTTHATAHAILVANVAPVATSTTANVSVAVVLVVHLLSLLLGMPLGLLLVHVVHSLGFYQLVNLSRDKGLGAQGVSCTQRMSEMQKRCLSAECYKTKCSVTEDRTYLCSCNTRHQFLGKCMTRWIAIGCLVLFVLAHGKECGGPWTYRAGQRLCRRVIR